MKLWPLRPQASILTMQSEHRYMPSTENETCLDILDQAGYQIHRVIDFDQLHVCARLEHTLVLLDISEFPGTDDTDVFSMCGVLRGRTHAPILLIVDETVLARVRGWCSGADACLSAPVSPDELLAVVHALVRSPRITLSGKSIGFQKDMNKPPAMGTAPLLSRGTNRTSRKTDERMPASSISESRRASPREQDMQLATRFYKDLLEGHVRLDLQPVLDCTEPAQVLYQEALLRIDTNGGLATESTEKIILALECIGMVRLLDHSVVHACIDRLEMQDELRLGCNISRQSTVVDAWWETIFHRLQADCSLAQRLTIEITESSDSEQKTVFSFVERLKSLGVQVAIDDFGVGYSNLAFALGCAADIIKIDRAFLEYGRGRSPHDALLQDMIQMCRSFAPKIVIEGVSDQSDLKRLSEIGGVYGQGYALGKPEPALPPLRVQLYQHELNSVQR